MFRRRSAELAIARGDGSPLEARGRQKINNIPEQRVPRTGLPCAEAYSYFSSGHSQTAVGVLSELNGHAARRGKPRSV